MSINSPILLIEINKYEFIFLAGYLEKNDEFKLTYKNSIPISGFSDNRISDFNEIYNLFKKNIYLIEKKLDIIFKDTIIIIDNFDCSLINFTGYKKLNGSQLVKENITYILNSLKLKINEIEKDKKILHIFNSKYLLDKKPLENLPIGLFGNFYSQELSFFLINNNDHKNIQNILNQCNLKIKKIISKNFIEGASLIYNTPDIDTFFKIKIFENDSQIILFENSALKFSQDFKFGTNLIINDISKVIGLKSEEVRELIQNSNSFENATEGETIDKKLFNYINFRKIKKKLIKDIAEARINEILEIIIIKNINLINFLNKNTPVFLEINDQLITKHFLNYFKKFLFEKKNVTTSYLDKSTPESLYVDAYRIVQYGWKKEALPIIQEKKSPISRIFDFIFN